MPWSTGRANELPSNWKALRRSVLRRDQNECQVRGPRCTETATAVDHIINHAEGGTDDPGNLQAICTPCHEDKTALEAGRGKRRHSPKRQPPQHPGAA